MTPGTSRCPPGTCSCGGPDLPHRPRPPWWDRELEISPHALKRMPERGFNETDLRLMLEQARHVDHDVEPGRWAAETALGGRRWRVILEPDPARRRTVVITAFELDWDAP